MRLLLVGPKAPPAGGIASSVAALDRALAAEGWDVRHVDPARGRGRLLFELARAALERRVIHLHVCGHNRSCYALIALTRLAAPTAPLVVTLHSGILPGFLARARPALVRAVLSSAQTILCVNEVNRQALAGIGIAAEVASPFVAEPPGCRRERAGAGRELCAMVAPEHYYGADLLVEAFAAIAPSMPEARLSVFGTQGADRAVEAALAARGLGQRVRALGELSQPRVIALLSSSDLLIRPTRADGDSMIVREALSVGCRVVASDAAVRPAAAVMFASGDATALAAAIERALAMPAPATKIEDGLATVRAAYLRALMTRKKPHQGARRRWLMAEIIGGSPSRTG